MKLLDTTGRVQKFQQKYQKIGYGGKKAAEDPSFVLEKSTKRFSNVYSGPAADDFDQSIVC